MAHIQSTPRQNVIDCGSSDSVIRFTADAKGGPERLWFDFHIDCSDDSAETLSLELHHCNSLLGGGNAAGSFFPVWQSDNQEWIRLGEAQRTIFEDGRFLLTWTVPMPKQSARIATCFPYYRSDLDNFMKDNALTCEEVGVSAQGRFLPRIHNRIDEVGSEKPGVFITARQHAGETPGSWILEGILAAFSDAQPDDPMLWVFPFIDLDGVEDCRYGKNHFPIDHNRSWYGCGLNHEVRVAMQQAHNWASRCKPNIYIDLHAPGLMEEGSYFFSGTEKPDMPLQTFLEDCQADLGSYACDKFIRQSGYQSVANAQVGVPTSLSANLFFKDAFNCLSTTMECSYQGFNGKTASQDDYREIGKRLAARIRLHCLQEQGAAATL